MVIAKSKAEIEKMYRAGQLVGTLLKELCAMAQPGVTTEDLDRFAISWLKERNAISPFKGYRGYPKHICTSINDEIVHGIPSPSRILKDGDIISIDCGATLDGYVADTAATIGVGAISDSARTLIKHTEASLFQAVGQMQTGNRLYDISYAVQSYIEPLGYSLVREFCGHGIGRRMHEDPQVPNRGRPNTGQRLRVGWVLAVEPMVNAGTHAIRVLNDGWTAVTLDGQLSAHFEHTIAITEEGPRVLTLVD